MKRILESMLFAAVLMLIILSSVSLFFLALYGFFIVITYFGFSEGVALAGSMLFIIFTLLSVAAYFINYDDGVKNEVS